MKDVISVDTTGGAISLQDLRDVFNRHGMNYSQIVGEDTTVVSCSLEGFNDAIEELLPIFHSLLISKLPEKDYMCRNSPDYKRAVEDMRKSIDELFRSGDES